MGGGSSLCLPSLWFNHWTTLQRHNNKNSKQIFPEKEFQGLSPNFHIHVSASDLYVFPGSVCLYSAAGNYVALSWEPINRSQTHECGNWDWGRAIPILGVNKWDFRCSAVTAIQPNVETNFSTVVLNIVFFRKNHTENKIFQKLYCFLTFFAKH